MIVSTRPMPVMISHFQLSVRVATSVTNDAPPVGAVPVRPALFKADNVDQVPLGDRDGWHL